MPPIHTLKSSFSGGEATPSLYSRVDLEKYRTMAKTLKNFFVHPHGGASNRTGFYYVATAKYDDKEITTIPFEYSILQNYVLEFGDYYVRFYSNGGQVAVTPADLDNFNPTTSYTTAGDFVNVGNYIPLNCGGTKRLFVSAPYEEDTSGKTVEVEIAGGDTLAVNYVAGAITISLANATPAKNKASLIQAALRSADASIDDWYVTENAAYAAARPTAGVTLVATALTDCDKTYFCILAAAGSADNTAFFPPIETTYWVNQIIYEIATPYSEAEIAYLNYTQSADVLYLSHPRFQTRTLSRYGATDFRLELYDNEEGPFTLQNTDAAKTLEASAVTGVGITLTAVGFTFEEVAGATHVGSLWQLIHNIEGQAVNRAVAGQSAGIKCGGTWRLISHGTWTGAFAIEKSTDGGSTWTNLRTFTGAADFNVNTFGTEDMSDNALPFLVRINITGGTPNVDLTTDPFVQKGVAKITAVVAGGATAIATVTREIGIAATATIDWAEGSWSDYRGWPTVVEFHPQDRLIFANTKTEPQTSWITKTGNYVNFSRSSPLVDSDGITVNLPARQVNGINGLVPLTELIALTASSEWGIVALDTVLTPTSVSQKVYGYEGSHGVRPVVIGNRAIYVQSMGQVIRDLGYELQSYSFTGGDLSVLSDHLFDGFTVRDMTYQQNPSRLVWVVRSDGALLSMTYMREQEVVAWTWHDTNQSGALAWVTATDYVIGNWVTSGGVTYKCATAHTSGVFADDLTAVKWVATDIIAEFRSCTSIPRTSYNELWVVIKRGTKRYIERQVQRLASTEPEDQIFMDSAITYDGVPAQVISNLGHLEGKTVAILADGNVLPQQVVLGAEITLDAEYSKVHVGIPYTSDLETLNIEVPLADGTLQGRKVKVSQVTFRLLNSRGGWIGPDFDTLHEISDTFRTLYGTAIALASGDIPENLGGGYAEGGRICLRQVDPLPITVLALIPVITPGGRTAI